MPVAEATKEINGRTYYVVQMPPTKAIPIQLKLTKMFGAAIGLMAPVLSTASKAGPEARMAAMGGAIGALFEKNNESEVFSLICAVVCTAKVDGKRIDDIDTAFQGEYLADLYKVFFWVLGVNFSSFFGEGGLEGLMARFTALFKQEAARMAQQAMEAQHSPTPAQN